jgi:hypothetical protein
LKPAVTIVTKSGTNAFHGSLFEFNLQRGPAKNFRHRPCETALQPERIQVFAGRASTQRATFSLATARLRERFPRTNTLSVGTAAMRDGDFSGLPAITDR